MTRRLFWKIFFGFWVTFILIIEGVWLVFTLRDVPPRTYEIEQARLSAEAELAAAAQVLRLGGRPALDALLAEWPADHTRRLALLAAEAPRPDDEQAIARTAELPDGGRLLLVYDARPAPRQRPGPFDIPPPLLVLGTLGGLAFSAALAFYLTRPISRLREGFAVLAGGSFSARLAPRMGRRRDEIADLARDFDRMAERLEGLVALRDQLLHDVSHELRSPLARLQVAIGLARQNPERFDSVLDRIEEESRRIDTMVGELLNLARAEAGSPPGEDYFDLGSLLEAVVQDARFEAGPAGIEIALRIDEAASALVVEGDAELMRRALENVLRNAIRHAPEGSRVDVDLAHPGDGVAITVADQGKGVAPEDLDRMFEPFVRGAGAAAQGGFGLGLAIARRAIRSHGGTIAAVNRPEGGLEVRIELPVRSP
ncbi:ATP-binding protein [Zavarzinia sp.]|uniref:HAMP domain-containing sensor histidine kinase n=1 Tax=Zavarzinia sp. TaxID=2027920 RepID=UPI003561F650